MVGHDGVTYKDSRKIPVIRLKIYLVGRHLVRRHLVRRHLFFGLSGDKLKGSDNTHTVPRVLNWSLMDEFQSIRCL